MNPDNYKTDSLGRLVPIEAIKPVDQARDELVIKLVADAKALRDRLRVFRELAGADIAAFAELSAERYGCKLGGKKGNITLVSFCGKFKILRAISDQLVFDERLQAAKELIDQCLHEWSEGSGKEIRALITDAFQVDKAGNINTARVLSLRSFDFDHPKWKLAMEAIGDSLRVAASRSYIRFYERNKAGGYDQINLDLANA